MCSISGQVQFKKGHSLLLCLALLQSWISSKATYKYWYSLRECTAFVLRGEECFVQNCPCKLVLKTGHDKFSSRFPILRKLIFWENMTQHRTDADYFPPVSIEINKQIIGLKFVSFYCEGTFILNLLYAMLYLSCTVEKSEHTLPWESTK